MSDTYKNLKSAIVASMKAKETDRLLALRSLDSAIKNIAIGAGNRGGPTEQDTIIGLSQAVKRGTDSIEQFRTAAREDLVDKEQFQVDIAKSFLPKQLSKEELSVAIGQFLSDYQAENGAVTSKDFGKLMKAAGGKFRGLTDNKSISDVLKAML